jgi:hypothetical protein
MFKCHLSKRNTKSSRLNIINIKSQLQKIEFLEEDEKFDVLLGNKIIFKNRFKKQF